MRPPDFWTRKDLVSRLAGALLTPFGWLYGWSVKYRAGHTATYRSAAKVVCVGNLTAGGHRQDADRDGDRQGAARARDAAGVT
ncbi:MAG: tetraacyldisaccharide 4'-kinase [Rhizomicrobium sp.]